MKTNNNIKETAKTVTYWREPTEAEIAFGYGAIHYLEVDRRKVETDKIGPNGEKMVKKWFINKEDGLSIPDINKSFKDFFATSK